MAVCHILSHTALLQCRKSGAKLWPLNSFIKLRKSKQHKGKHFCACRLNLFFVILIPIWKKNCTNLQLKQLCFCLKYKWRLSMKLSRYERKCFLISCHFFIFFLERSQWEYKTWIEEILKLFSDNSSAKLQVPSIKFHCSEFVSF